MEEKDKSGFIEGSTIQPPKEDILPYIKYMQGDIRARRILIESIKDSFIPYVLKLEPQKKYMINWWNSSQKVLKRK